MTSSSTPKRILRGIAAFLPHLLMVYGLMLLTFYVINIFNDSMGFLSSRVSRHFEIVYTAVTFLTVLSCFLQKRIRIFAAGTAASAVVFVIPVIRALIEDSPVPLDTAFFRTICLLFSLVTIGFSVTCIVLQRRAGKQTQKE